MAALVSPLRKGDLVGFRAALLDARGRVEWVSADGRVVSVSWENRFGAGGNKTTTERAEDLQKLSG